MEFAAGPYGVTETKPITTKYRTSIWSRFSSDCVGTINDGETKTCMVTNVKTGN